MNEEDIHDVYESMDVYGEGPVTYKAFHEFTLASFDYDLVILTKALHGKEFGIKVQAPALLHTRIMQTIGNAHIGSVRKVAESPIFDRAITIAIALNILILALDRYPISETEAQVEDLISFGFTVVFVIELTVKLVGLSKFFHIYTLSARSF